MKRSNIAEFGSETEVAIPDSAISFDSDQPMPPERISAKVGVATCMTLRILSAAIPLRTKEMAYLFFSREAFSFRRRLPVL